MRCREGRDLSPRSCDGDEGHREADRRGQEHVPLEPRGVRSGEQPRGDDRCVVGVIRGPFPDGHIAREPQPIGEHQVGRKEYAKEEISGGYHPVEMASRRDGLEDFTRQRSRGKQSGQYECRVCLRSGRK